MYGVSELECVCRGCPTDAVGRPAARSFVQDAQGHSAVRQLYKSVETESRPTFRQSHGTLGVANEWPSCGRRPASVSQPHPSHTRGQLRHTMRSPPCEFRMQV